MPCQMIDLGPEFMQSRMRRIVQRQMSQDGNDMNVGSRGVRIDAIIAYHEAQCLGSDYAQNISHQAIYTLLDPVAHLLTHYDADLFIDRIARAMRGSVGDDLKLETSSGIVLTIAENPAGIEISVLGQGYERWLYIDTCGEHD